MKDAWLTKTSPTFSATVVESPPARTAASKSGRRILRWKSRIASCVSRRCQCSLIRLKKDGEPTMLPKTALRSAVGTTVSFLPPFMLLLIGTLALAT